MRVIRIRRAKESDRDAILDADRACLPDDLPSAWEGDTWWLALSESGAIAGYAAARPSLQTPGGVYLCRAGVLPEWRGQGLQRRLIRARERWARAAGYTSAVTDTYRNPASSNNLIACGYRMWTPAVPWSYMAACYWYRNLNAND